MKLSITLFCAAISCLSFGLSDATAQGWCATDEHAEELRQKFPELARQREITEALRTLQIEEAAQNTANKPQNTVRVIPVVVHIITETGLGGLTKQQVLDGIQVLNEDFRRTNADTTDTRAIFKPYAVDTEVEFRLAKIDPNGNCTEGIVRAASPLTNSSNPRDMVKGVSYWPSDKYFNVWIVNSIYSANAAPGSYVAGYAQFPGTGLATTFGFVCRADAWGLGQRTATHEVGHCLNLYHTFQGGCGSSCSNTGDRVCDTPPSEEALFGCNNSQNTCANDPGTGSVFSSNVPDQIENYMSYNDCQNMYTAGQKLRINNAFDTDPLLQSLVSPANAIATGIYNPTVVCAPIVDFSATTNIVCEGGTVTLFDRSYNAPVDSSWTWTWTLPGATPATSNDQNPTVTYANPGVYPVTLSVTNSAGSDQIARSAFIEVRTTQGIDAPFTQDMETPGFPAHPTDTLQDWTIIAASSNTWQRYTGAGALGTASMQVRNQVIGNGFSNSLESPAIDLSPITGASLKFDVAYSRATNGGNDQLKVYFSTDCGRTWTLRYAKSGGALSTVAGQNNSWEPSSPADWRQETVAISGSFTGATNFRVRFESTSAQGNAIYLDNINISGVLGMEEDLRSGMVSVFPNPASGAVTVQLTLTQDAKVSGQLLDVLGREVLTLAPQQASAGTLEIPVSVASLAPGVYVLRLTDGASVVTRKLIKE